MTPIVIYADSFYSSLELPVLAKQFLACLPKHITSIVSIGSSGNCIASAMLALSDRPLIHAHLRKPDEVGNNHRYDNFIGVKPVGACAIVDDIIDTGASMTQAIKIARNCGFVPEIILVGHIFKDADPAHIECPVDLPVICVERSY